MYEAYYNLKHKPFSLLPDPEFLFLSSKHAIALSLLEYSLSGQAGFCVITGEIGSGKTTLIRAFLNRIGREFTVGMISNTHSSLSDVSAWVLNAFGKKVTGSTPADTYQELMSFLIAEYGAGRQCILILDEAQNLSVESLEELRLLSNINSGKDLLLQMVLSGQPQLLEKLRRPELIQFAQRISVSYHLLPLAYVDTRKYIEHRLKVAGAGRPIFTEMAMGAVQYFSGGVPRLINSICDMALVYGFADDLPEIDEDLVLRVISDRQVSGIAPFARGEVGLDPKVRAEIRNLARSDQEGGAPPPKAANQDSNVNGTAFAAAPALPPQAPELRQALNTPAQHTPVQHAPVQLAPVQHALAQPAPAQLAPVQHAPAQHTPAEHTPAQRAPQAVDIPAPVKIVEKAEPEHDVRQDLVFPEPDTDDTDDDELILTTEVTDDTEEEARSSSAAPVALGRPDLALSVTAQSHPEEVSPIDTPVLRRPRQVLTGDNSARNWPSVRNDVTLEPQARESSGIASELGTTTTPRRSWWRRSFSRGG